MKYGLVGASIKHSYAEEFHEYISSIDYEIASLDQDEFLKLIKSKKFKGLNITIPYKEMVIPYLDEIDEGAKAIGSINTIINKNNRLIGYNVDIDGLRINLEHNHVEIKNKNVLILGTGGTSKTASYLCKEILGAQNIYFASRHSKKQNHIYSYQELNFISSSINVIINTTPLGMFPHEDDDLLLNLDDFNHLEAVVDCIYNPYKTKLLIDAKYRHLKYVNGMMMLIGQGVKANNLFLNTHHKIETYLDSYLKIITKDINLILIGMPGAGKGKIAKALSDKLHMEAIDVDANILHTSGMHYLDIILKRSEQDFRKLETATLKRLTSQHNKIISTGSGIVLDENNIKMLESHSIIIYIDRDIDLIERHLSAKQFKDIFKIYGSVEEAYSIRKPLYEKYADIIVKNTSTIEACANKIINAIKGIDVKESE